MGKFCPAALEEDEMEPHRQNDKCKEVFSVLSEYLDLELPPDACEEIDAHVGSCPPCIEFVESLRKTVELCRSYQPRRLPEPIGERAREELLQAYRKMLASGKMP